MGRGAPQDLAELHGVVSSARYDINLKV